MYDPERKIILILTRSGSGSPSGRWISHASKEQRAVCEFHLSEHVQIKAHSMDLLYNECIRRFYITYLERNNKDGQRIQADDQRWCLRVHVWDIDT
jgi:hypothetical protein